MKGPWDTDPLSCHPPPPAQPCPFPLLWLPWPLTPLPLAKAAPESVPLSVTACTGPGGLKTSTHCLPLLRAASIPERQPTPVPAPGRLLQAWLRAGGTEATRRGAAHPRSARAFTLCWAVPVSTHTSPVTELASVPSAHITAAPPPDSTAQHSSLKDLVMLTVPGFVSLSLTCCVLRDARAKDNCLPQRTCRT